MAALHPVPHPAPIATKLCPRRHPNDPAVVCCRICGAPLDPVGAVIAVAPEPLGRLLLEDGTAVDLTGALVIGRSPALRGPAGTDTLTVTGRQVSRVHVLVRATGWQLTVQDCDSTNGTTVATPGVRGRRRVPSDRPAPLAIGDTVHFGARQALVVEPNRR